MKNNTLKMALAYAGKFVMDCFNDFVAFIAMLVMACCIAFLILLVTGGFNGCNGQSGNWCWSLWSAPVENTIYQNKVIAGVNIARYWSNLNPAPGVYDFSNIDTELNKCITSGKQAAISVAAAGRSPQWIKEKSLCLKFDEVRKDGDGKAYDLLLPLPYDTFYLTNWCRFIDALGNHINSNQAFKKVVVAVSLSGVSTTTCEWRLPTSNDSLLLANGYTGRKLIATFNTIRSQFIYNFPDKHLIIDMMLDDEFPHTATDTVIINTKILEKCSANKSRYYIKATSLTNNSRGTVVKKALSYGLATGWQTNQSIYGAEPCSKSYPCNPKSFTDALNIAKSCKVNYVEMQQQTILNYFK